MLPQLQPLLLVYSGIQLLPGLVLGGCKCPGMYPFLPALLGYVHRVVCSDLFKKPALGFIDFLKGFSCLNLLQLSSDLSNFLSSAGF